MEPLHRKRGLGRLALLLWALALGLGCSGTLESGERDADAEGERIVCGAVLCPEGAICVDDLCVASGPCGGTTCAAGEVCVDRRCTPWDPGDGGEAGVDEDGDGYGAAEDCDDQDPEVTPGVTAPCSTGCGEGVQTCGADGSWGPCEHPADPCELPNASSTCVEGACRLTGCVAGFYDCDERPETGCESAAPCGGISCPEAITCMRACAADLDCAARCRDQVCPASEGDADALIECIMAHCAGSCADLSSSGCEACVGASCSGDLEACLGGGC